MSLFLVTESNYPPPLQFIIPRQFMPLSSTTENHYPTTACGNTALFPATKYYLARHCIPLFVAPERDHRPPLHVIIPVTAYYYCPPLYAIILHHNMSLLLGTVYRYSSSPNVIIAHHWILLSLSIHVINHRHCMSLAPAITKRYRPLLHVIIPTIACHYPRPQHAIIARFCIVPRHFTSFPPDTTCYYRPSLHAIILLDNMSISPGTTCHTSTPPHSITVRHYMPLSPVTACHYLPPMHVIIHRNCMSLCPLPTSHDHRHSVHFHCMSSYPVNAWRYHPKLHVIISDN